MGGILPLNQEIIQRPGAREEKGRSGTSRAAWRSDKLGVNFLNFQTLLAREGCISRGCPSSFGEFLVVLGALCLRLSSP
jgi:hypothetical protein